jgi:hypothetical protein
MERTKFKYHMIIPINAEKNLEKFNICYYNSPYEAGIEGT